MAKKMNAGLAAYFAKKKGTTTKKVKTAKKVTAKKATKKKVNPFAKKK